MGERGRERILLVGVMFIGLAIFITGIGWGLPSRRADRFLFGDEPIWTGEQIAQFAVGRNGSSNLGSDVDRNPVQRGIEPVLLNDTDSRRAEIVRRFRLFTYQPDEMITLMALASMKPARWDFDPRLYQYGGLWIYPVGAMVRLIGGGGASQAYYIDHPEEFGRFYVAARAYAAVWGLIGVWAVFVLARRAGAGVYVSAGAGLLYVLLPVVVNMSHEAKPHLPGAVLILLAVLAAQSFVESGKHRWWIIAGVLCGMAMGMILSGAVAFLLLPAMVMMRPLTWRHRFAIVTGAVAAGVLTFFITNPYVLLHLLGDGSVLQSNLGNTAVMYQFGQIPGALVNAGRLLIEGATPLVVIVGLLGMLGIAWSGVKPQAAGLRLLAMVSLVILAQFVLVAAGKPGEYGRFAILPDIALALLAATLIGRSRIRSFEKAESIGLLMVVALLPAFLYLRGFVRDSSVFPRRLENARTLLALQRLGASSIGVFDEPAPYLLPPIDLFHWKIFLLPRELGIGSGGAPVDVIVRPVDQLSAGPLQLGAYRRITERSVDDVFPSRISWANKPVEIWVRNDLLSQSALPRQ
jgi:hypothetical protein